MEKRLILRGILCGGIGGLLAFWFARILAEPEIDRAIDYEAGRAAAQEALDRAAGLPIPAEEADVFTRAIQADVGLGVGLVVFGMAIGALFAVAYCLYVGRVGRLRPRTLAVLVAGGGFLTLYLVPFLKYPASPPAVGHDETIGTRSALYLIMVACGLLFLVGAVWLGQQLAPRIGNWNASLAAGGAYILAMGLVIALMPSLGDLSVNRETYGDFGTETPQPLTDPDGNIVFPGFPADVLYRFRLYSVGAQLVLWTAIGLCFAPLAERVLAPARRRAKADGAAGQATG